MKKSILLISIFITVFLLAGLSSQALIAPQIYFEDIDLERETFAPGQKIKGTVSLWNYEQTVMSDLVLNFRLLANEIDGVYNQMIDEQKTEETFSLSTGQKVNKSFSYTLPANLPSGKLGFRIQLTNSRGEEMGWLDKEIIIESDNKFLLLDNYWIIKGEEKLPPGAGINYNPGEIPNVIFDVTNDSSFNISAFYKIITYKRNIGGDVVNEETKQEIDLESGAKLSQSAFLPQLSAPNTYLSEIKFYDKETQEPISNAVYFRWVISGNNAEILFVKPDKDFYQKGEEAKIEVEFVGPADSDLHSGGQGNIEIELFNQKEELVGKISKDIILVSSKKVFNVPINKEINNPKIVIKILKDGQVLDEYILSVNFKGEETGQRLNKITILIVSIVILIIIIMAFIIHSSSKKKYLFLVFLFGIGFLLFGSQALAVIEIDIDCCGTIVQWNAPLPNQTFAPGDTVRFSGSFRIAGCNNGLFFNKITFYITEDKDILTQDCCGNDNFNWFDCWTKPTSQCQCQEGCRDCYGATSTHYDNCREDDHHYHWCDRVARIDMSQEKKIYKLGEVYPSDVETGAIPYQVSYNKSFVIPKNLEFSGPVRFYIQYSGTHISGHWHWSTAYQRALIASHKECKEKPGGWVCEPVEGAGIDDCQNDNDCYHKECVGEACETVGGPGQDLCSNNDDCVVAVHNECYELPIPTTEPGPPPWIPACRQVVGPGEDQCQNNGDCGHQECDDNGYCSLVSGRGSDQCGSHEDCGYDLCFGRTCIRIPGSGEDECAYDTDCQHLRCVGESCQFVEGPGTDQCSSNDDCVLPITYNRCMGNACTLVPETELPLDQQNDECSSDLDCRTSYLESLAVRNQEYCLNVPNKGEIRLKWIYKTNIGFRSSLFRLRIYEQGQTNVVYQKVINRSVDDGTEIISDLITIGGPGKDLEFGKTYTWQVMVRDNIGNRSEYLGPPFDTPANAYPYPDFSFSPDPSILGQPTNFQNNTQFFDAFCIADPDRCIYVWDFDDNATVDSSDRNPSYSYPNDGAYRAKLTVFDSNNYSCSTKRSVLVGTSGALESLGIKEENYCLDVPGQGEIKLKWVYRTTGNKSRLYRLKIYEQGETTPVYENVFISRDDDNTEVVSDLITIGPGQNLEFGKTYDWKVMVTDERGNESEYVDGPTLIMPDNAYPYPDFSYNPDPSISGQPTNFQNNTQFFDAFCIADPDKCIYVWDFDDNATVDSSDRNPSHVYPNDGTYQAKLTVFDSNNYSCPIKKDVIVNPSGVIVNQNPIAENLNLDIHEYCNVGPGQGEAVLRWVYSDPEGDSQDQYNLQITTTGNFASPDIDIYRDTFRGQPTGNTNTSPVIKIVANPNPSNLEIAYNKFVRWRVKVQDENGNWSEDWETGAFLTRSHALPYPDFEVSPIRPIVNNTVNFIDRSKCYPGGVETNCSAAMQYRWNFGDGSSIDNTKGDTSHIYSAKNHYRVNLAVRDNAGVCSIEKIVSVGSVLTPPDWWEIIPPLGAGMNEFVPEVISDIYKFLIGR